MQKWTPDKVVKEVDFSVSFFWIQVQDLPPDQINVANVAKIGNLFSGLIEDDISGEEEGR
ncbi:conserved hypothetical protein [Ricinus communis]|uniref:DUF4283 domain-containing protein n=1 Tax=Ricinus communis TaxID=3988 RepID=B9RVM6_RICCO|nr:conserved hypothetical protein [Ricinus communis]